MASDRVHPPSPRRQQLARAAGVIALAPTLTAAAAWLGAAVGATWVLAHGHSGVAPAIERAVAPSVELPALADVVRATLALAAPILLGALAAALLAHAAQARGLWLPRRRISGAPAEQASAGRRLGQLGLDMFRLAAVAGATLAWLALAAPAVQALLVLPADQASLTLPALLLAAGLLLAAALVLAGALELLVRALARRADARMTDAERREDRALAGRSPPRRPPRDAGPAALVRRCQLLATDGSTAVAVDVRGDRPHVAAIGHGLDAVAMLAAARHHRVAIHRDAGTTALLAAGQPGPADPRAWPRLAELVALASPATPAGGAPPAAPRSRR